MCACTWYVWGGGRSTSINSSNWIFDVNHSNANTKLTLILHNLQVYTWLNLLNVTLSYCAVLRLVNGISERHRAPIERWIQEGFPLSLLAITSIRRSEGY